MTMLQLKAIKTLECVKTVEKDCDYKVLTSGMSEKEYVAYLAGVNPKENERKEVKLAVFDTGTSNSAVNFAENAGETDNSNTHGAKMMGIISSVISDKENRFATPLIYSVAVADHRGFAKTSAIMQAIDWVINNGIKIINMSLGDYRKSNLLEQMINKAAKCGIIMVAAAGNDGGFKDENRIMYPAAYKNVLSVGAKDGEKVATYSSGGLNADCFAPGTNNVTDANGNTIGVIGTSVAAAFVSGSILKKWCISPDSSAKDIVVEIKSEMIITPEKEIDAKALTSDMKNDTIINENNYKTIDVNVALEHIMTSIIKEENLLTL